MSFIWEKIFDGLQCICGRAPLYWSLGSNILEPLRFKKQVFFFLNMKHGKQKVSSPLLRPSCDTQNLVLSELSLFIPSQNLENKI